MAELAGLFFPPASSGRLTRITGGGGSKHTQQTVLLAGEASSPKRFLVAWYAYNAALRGCRVGVFSPRPSQTSPPLPSLLPTDGLDDTAMERILMKYVETSAEVLACAGEMHREEPRPNLIIVEGLVGLAGGGQDAVGKLSVALAQLTNLVAFISDLATACELIVTEEVNAEGRPHQLYIYERWMDVILTARDTSDSCAELQRVKCPPCGPNCPNSWVARFEVGSGWSGGGGGLNQGQGVRFCCEVEGFQ